MQGAEQSNPPVPEGRQAGSNASAGAAQGCFPALPCTAPAACPHPTLQLPQVGFQGWCWCEGWEAGEQVAAGAKWEDTMAVAATDGATESKRLRSTFTVYAEELKPLLC